MFSAGLIVVTLLVLATNIDCKPYDDSLYVYQHSSDFKHYTTGNMNDYLDEVLKNAKSQFKQLNADPLSLPDSHNSFQKKILFINFYGGFETKNGRLQGLSTLHRAGDATMTLDANNVMTVKATMAIDTMDVGTNARAWFGKINIGFWIGAKVNYLKATAELRIPLNPGGQPRATRLDIHDIGKINLNVQNLGPLNWVFNGFGFVFLNMLKGVLKSKLSAPILNAINNIIGKIKLP